MKPLASALFAEPSAAAMVIAVGLAGLVSIASAAAPGCTGPVSAAPCDFVAIAKRAAERFDGHEPSLGHQVVDWGSSAYVHQPLMPGWLDGPPAVLIDRRSCRVCEVRSMGSLPLPDPAYGDAPMRIVLNHPPDDLRTYRREYGNAERDILSYPDDRYGRMMRRELAQTIRW